MQQIISTFENCIASVQLKLSDYFSGISTLKDGIVSHFSESRERNINNSHELVLHAGNQFEIYNPRCPACGSSKIIKQEYYQRNLKLAELGQQKIRVRRYYCKTCNKKFTTPLDAIVKKGHQYAKIYQKNIKESYGTGYCSFRHLKKIFLSIYENAPSHQTIYNWIKNAFTKSKSRDSNFSGYYCYDEQYLRFNGQRVYRLSMFDSLLNKPVIEDIYDNLEYDTIDTFIRKAISDKPVHAITTDHRRKYKRILDKLRINHQLCIFHLFEMIGKKVYPKLNSEFVSDHDKI